MNLETFFNKFDELADTPNGVKQLRELVMQLAVEGGLVPHSAAEPAVPYASVEDATPINIADVPENWRVVLLADAIKNRSGNSKLIKGKLHEEPAAGRFQGFSASGADVWCDDYEHEGHAIIISAVGARCGKAFKASGKWCAIANTNITRPEPSLFDFDFAYLVLNNEHFWVRGGSAQPFVKFPPSLGRHFALPPLAEQKRIVAKVDELMALCDRLEAQQQERETRHAALARASLARFADAPTPANLQFLFHLSYSIPPADLRKSILTLAVQGKLVPQDPNDDDASTLLEKIRVAKAAMQKGQRSRLAESDNSGSPASEPYELPPGWVWTVLGEVQVFTNGFAFKSEDYQESGIGIVRMGELGSNGEIDESDMKYVSEQIAQSLPETFRVKPGDLLMGMSGSIGKLAINRSPKTYLLNQRVGRLEPVLVEKPYLQVFLRTVEQHYLEISFGMAIKNLSTKQINETAFPLPPLAEQRRIVTKVEQLMALLDALETQLAASRAIAANLLSALVAELTTKD
jgi:type I restriction enzyme S subunit